MKALILLLLPLSMTGQTFEDCQGKGCPGWYEYIEQWYDLRGNCHTDTTWADDFDRYHEEQCALYGHTFPAIMVLNGQDVLQPSSYSISVADSSGGVWVERIYYCMRCFGRFTQKYYQRPTVYSSLIKTSK